MAIYDKDLCRAFPLQYRHLVDKDGISAGYYTPPDSIFAPSEAFPDNKCFCNPGESPTAPCELKGLQNISPCHYGKRERVSSEDTQNARTKRDRRGVEPATLASGPHARARPDPRSHQDRPYLT